MTKAGKIFAGLLAAASVMGAELASAVTDATPEPVVRIIRRDMVYNGRFEEPFQEGVAQGWRAHARGDGGYVAENPKTGRVGGGLYGAERCSGGVCEEDVQTLRMSAKVHLVDAGRVDMVSRIREQMGPDAIVVLKLGPEDWQGRRGRPNLEGDIEANGAAFAEYCYQESSKTGHWPRCYYGQNEPDMNNAEALARVCRFELGFTRRLHQLGLRSCVVNHSVGTPGPKENMYIPEMRELLAAADYVGYHCYGGPEDELMCAESSLHDYSLRWRQFAKGYEERGWRFPPVIYTEGTTWGGWIDRPERFTPATIRDDILCFEGKMREDPWAVGLAVFVTGAWPGQEWRKWDITRFPETTIDPIRERNRTYPIDAHGGSGSQVIGGNGEPVDRAVCQQVPARPGRRYAFSGWFKFEFFDCQGKPLGHRASAQIGFDTTGQTSRLEADTIRWSDNLIGKDIIETDIWYQSATEFQAESGSTSIWIRFRHPDPKPSTRLCIDDVSLREL